MKSSKKKKLWKVLFIIGYKKIRISKINEEGLRYFQRIGRTRPLPLVCALRRRTYNIAIFFAPRNIP